MREQGRLTDWKDDRGFGFITPLGGGATVFAHVSQFPQSQRRPMVTDLVTYLPERDDRGRPRARDIQFLAPTRMRTARHEAPQPSVSITTATIVVFLFAGILAVAGAVFPVAWLILGVDVVVSAATVLAYRSDKLAAQRGRRRTEENALHLMELGGGWPGALVAQQLYRHKTRKQSFQIVFWLMVIVNVGFSVWLITAF